MNKSHQKYATVTHSPGSGRITFSNDGQKFLEIGNDVGTNHLLLQIPDTIPEDERKLKYQELADSLRDANVDIVYKDKTTGKLQGEHSYSIVVPFDPKRPQQNLLRLAEYLENRASFSGSTHENRVSPIPRSFESNESGEMLNPYAKLVEYATVKQGDYNGLYKAAASFVDVVNQVKKEKGEQVGHAATTSGRDGSFTIGLGRNS